MTNVESAPAGLSPAALELQERARRYVDEVLIPLEQKAELAGGPLPADDVQRIRQTALEQGMAGGLHAPEHGGQGWTTTEWLLVEEQFGRNTNGISWYMPTAYNVWRSASPSLIDRWLRPALKGELHDAYAVTEAEAGSDPSGISTVAHRSDDGGYVINGEKWFVTYGSVAAVIVVMANVIDGDDRLPTLFAVPADAPGVSIVDDPPFTHAYPHGHPTMLFTDVKVSADDVIGGVGQGDDLQRMWFTEERIGIAVRCIGAMQRLITETTAVGHQPRAGRSSPHRPPGCFVPARRLRGRCRRRSAHGLRRCAPQGVRRRSQAHPRQGVDGQALLLRGGQPVRRPVSADLRRPRIHAHQCRRALLARAEGRPHLGGHQRDPATDRCSES